MCTRPSSAFRARFESLTARFLTCTRTEQDGKNEMNFIFMEINEQMTEFVCEHPRVYNLRLSHYNGAKITKNTSISCAVELDIDVSSQC